MSGRLAHAPAQCLACVLSHDNGGDDVDVVDVDVDTGYLLVLLVIKWLSWS